MWRNRLNQFIAVAAVALFLFVAPAAQTQIGNFIHINVGGKPLAEILRATVTLTDAQIKALPTTPITVLAAPGSGILAHLIGGRWAVNTVAGAYTNINSGASFSLKYADGSNCSAFVVNDGTITGGAVDNVTQFLNAGAKKRFDMQPYSDVDTSGSWGLVPSIQSVNNGVNSAIRVVFDNGGSGNLTGGNAANTLQITVFYALVTIP